MRRADKRCVAALVMVALALMVGRPAMATPYGGEDEGWEGYSQWVAMAEQGGLSLSMEDRLEWDRLEVDDVLVVVYPEVAIDVGDLASFVSDGGRVLWIDDFGQSDEWLERLGIRRDIAEDGLPHRRFVDDEPGWPVVQTSGHHPLIDGVREVVANYPAVLHHPGGAVMSYDDEGGLVYDMVMGEGRVVVMADPGLFINGMLEVADNRRLAANTLSYLCEEGDCRGWMVGGVFETSGRYGEASSQGLVDTWNRRIQEVFRELPETPWMVWVVLFISMGAMAYLGSWFRWRNPGRLSSIMDGHRRDIAPPMTEYDWHINRFCGDAKRVNYALPAAILKERFQVFWDDEVAGQGPDGEVELGADAIVGAFGGQWSGEERRRRQAKLRSFMSQLEEVPDRAAIVVDKEPFISGVEFDGLARGIEDIVDWIGKKDEYERRFRELQRPAGWKRRTRRGQRRDR